jgi:protein-arginine kinase activator protein McsA
MSISRSIKRRKMLAGKRRTTCPKCHATLKEKPGYGTVCVECGWWKKEETNND